MKRLVRELAYFDQNRGKWVEEDHQGEWAVIHEEALVGFFDSLEDAYSEGAQRFGREDFLAKEVTLRDRVEEIQRAFWRRPPSH